MAKGETYEEFVEKFKPKLTTDDCYTPANIYDAVADWVCGRYGVSRDCFVRPFFPGGDYENYEYPPDCVVVDNPPFSIMNKICRFYMERGIRFFLFAPSLTLFGLRSAGDFFFPNEPPQSEPPRLHINSANASGTLFSGWQKTMEDNGQ